MESCWWQGEDNFIYTYTTKLEINTKISIMGIYGKTNDKKIIAHQYKVERDSDEHRELTEKLKLNKKNEIKDK